MKTAKEIREILADLTSWDFELDDGQNYQKLVDGLTETIPSFDSYQLHYNYSWTEEFITLSSELLSLDDAELVAATAPDIKGYETKLAVLEAVEDYGNNHEGLLIQLKQILPGLSIRFSELEEVDLDCLVGQLMLASDAELKELLVKS